MVGTCYDSTLSKAWLVSPTNFRMSFMLSVIQGTILLVGHMSSDMKLGIFQMSNVVLGDHHMDGVELGSLHMESMELGTLHMNPRLAGVVHL